MWQIIPSLANLLQDLAPVFTEPTCRTQAEVLLGWLMCLGRRTEYRVFEAIDTSRVASRAQRHPFDRFYNFFSRSAWTVTKLGHELLTSIVTHLHLSGVLYVLVDDTLLHKRGKHVYGLGWFRDAVASTAKRVATASGNNWVVLALALPVPKTHIILALPLLARLHVVGKNQPSPPDLAKAMLREVLGWYPQFRLVLMGDGGYSAENLLKDLDQRVTYVGRLRADAEVYDPVVPAQAKSKRGRKPQKGPRLPGPKEAAQRADAQRTQKGPWAWQTVEAMAYGVTRGLRVLAYTVVWPEVFGLRPIRIVVVRDPAGTMKDAYLFTTDLTATLDWVITTYAMRWSIEVAFKNSKQVLDIEGPQHWCQGSIEKLAPWLWQMQSVLTLWYLTVGHTLPEAQAARERMGPWDSEWSLRHIVSVLRTAVLEQTINPQSGAKANWQQLLGQVKKYLTHAAFAG
jgi:DDE superfamily endonuclease/putative transposase ISC1217